MLNFVAIPKGINTTPGTSELYRLPPACLAGYLEEIFLSYDNLLLYFQILSCSTFFQFVRVLTPLQAPVI